MGLSRKHLSIILALSLVLAMPCMSYGTEAESFDVPQDESATMNEVDVSVMDGERAAEDELLVLIEEGTSQKEINNIAEDAGANLDGVSTLIEGKKLVSISLDDPDDAQEVADSLAAEDKVLIVQPNYRYRLSGEEEEAEELQPEQPSDQESEEVEAEDTELTAESEEDAQTEANAEAGLSPKAQPAGTNKEGNQWYMGGGPGGTYGFQARDHLSHSTNNDSTNKVKVAVIDTGVRLNHPDLKDVVIEEECVSYHKGRRRTFDYKDGSDDDDGHGTHVCGLIAAEADDDYGISGMSDNRAELIVIDAENDGYFETRDITLGINYAALKGAKIINMSLGDLIEDTLLDETINSVADEMDVLCVCAAGNENSYLPETPGDIRGALSVIAHDENGDRADFSNKGAEKDVSAPGTNIYSTYRDRNDPAAGAYKYLDGTSMAAPLVTGLAALIKAENGNLNVREIKNYIYTSSGSRKFDAESGFGKINAKTAIISVNSEAEEPDALILNKTEISMHSGEVENIEFAVYPATAGTYADETAFSSSDKSIATVDEYGHIEAKKKGEVIITASCRGVNAECKVRVAEPPLVTVNSIPYYNGNATFSPSDHKFEFSYHKANYPALADSYKIKASNAARNIMVKVTSSKVVPYVRVYDSGGKEIATNLTVNIAPENWGEKGNVYIATASFKPKASGTYRIMALGASYGDPEVNKRYSIRIDEFAKMSEASIKLVNKTYTGSRIVQDPTVKYNGFRLVNGEDYKLSYSNNKYIGVARVTVSGLGAYEGSVTKTFKILPKGTKLGKLKKGSKSVSVKWTKRSSRMPAARINGYQLQLATDSKFTKNVKSVKVKGYKKTSKKISKLKKKTKYYVRIRTYIKTGGTTYYSGWSKAKSIKTR